MKNQKYNLKCPRCNSPARLLGTKSKDGNSTDFKYESAYITALATIRRVRDGGLSPQGQRQIAHECLLELGETV